MKTPQTFPAGEVVERATVTAAPINPERRWWITATTVVGGTGLVAAAFRPTPGAPDIGASWPGGFYCPCHGSKFDFAGRVFKNVPAPTKLVVPSYHFASESTLRIGVDAKT